MTLNGPSRIYHLKPVFQLADNFQTNCSMYKMRNLHEQPAIKSSTSENSSENQADSNESKIIFDVLRRQEELIRSLQSIQSKVTDLKKELTTTASKTLSKENTKESKKPLKSVSYNVAAKVSKDAPLNTKNIVINNPVVNLSPHRPAYSLLTIPHIWGNVFKSQQFNMHVHSSVSEIPKAFSKSARGTNLNNKENTVFDMRLIWKDVQDTELISSPIKQSPLLGEVSMLRLFHRMFSTDTGTAQGQVALDSALDICHQLLYTSQKHTALSLVKKLSDLLGTTEWMLGSPSLTVVDAAAWSAILNVSHLVQPKQLGPSLAKWSQKINSLVGITYAMAARK